ncbi:MAG TPA: class I SAM-dependent methyltransferase [Gemmatimonadaceae bacterium]
MDCKAHWERLYTTKQPAEVSWYQPQPARSLELLRQVGAGPETAIIDVGGGDSTLVDAVVAEHLGRLTVLDVSAVALGRARERLAARNDEVTWMEADITRVELPAEAFDIWHDRAVFHFLVHPDDRMRYVTTAKAALRPGGTLLLATFAPAGPARCSGLEVARYSAGELARELGEAFLLTRSFMDVHHTPAGIEQPFTYTVFRYLA